MRAGYLSIETHHERPGLVRLFLSTESPDPSPAGAGERRIRYVGQFNDREAGMMHTHEILKRRLIDPDAHLYRAPLELAIAAAESLDLKHRRIYLDPELNSRQNAEIDVLTRRLRKQRAQWDNFFQTLGYIGIGLLLLNLFFLSLA